MHVIAEPTAEHPTVPLTPPVPPADPERGRRELGALIFGCVLLGALVMALVWWRHDPEMPREAEANLIFMTLTSGAVVGLIYAIVSACVRREVGNAAARILYAVETNAQSLRAQNREILRQVVAGCEEGRRSRRALAMQLAETQPHPLPRTQRRPRRKQGNGAEADTIDTQHRWLSQAVETGRQLERHQRDTGEDDGAPA